MEQQQFQENVKEWVFAINEVIKQLRDEIDEVRFAQDEDMITLGFQYKMIKQLRKDILDLKRDLCSLKKMRELNSNGKDISEESNRQKQVP